MPAPATMILCVGTTPAVQRVMIFPRLALDSVNRAATTLDGVAGKSVNVAKVLHALGERACATGFLGGDRGQCVRAALAGRGIEQDFVTVATRTRQCVTVIDEASGTVTELVEESRPVEAAEWERLRTIIRQRLVGCSAAILSGTIAPGGPADLYAECTRQAHAAGALAVVDAQGEALIEALKAKPAVVKPNRAELAATVGRGLPDDEAVQRAMRELAERGAQQVIVTAGKDPTLAYDGRRSWRITVPRIHVVNPIGSGDAFAAGLAWRLARGDDLPEACRWAGACGAANALTPLAGELDRADVERLVLETRVEPA